MNLEIAGPKGKLPYRDLNVGVPNHTNLIGKDLDCQAAHAIISQENDANKKVCKP